jgi:hypothetical protein
MSKRLKMNSWAPFLSAMLMMLMCVRVAGGQQEDPRPEVIYWPDEHRPPNVVGLPYSPQVLARLAANSSHAPGPRIQTAIARGTPIIVMWAIPKGNEADEDPPRPLSAVIVDDTPDGRTSWSLKRIEPLWLEQNAEELRASDGQTKFRDVGIMAAFPRSAFVRGRLVTIFRDLPAEPGVHRGVQVFGRLNWRGDL